MVSVVAAVLIAVLANTRLSSTQRRVVASGGVAGVVSANENKASTVTDPENPSLSTVVGSGGLGLLRGPARSKAHKSSVLR